MFYVWVMMKEMVSSLQVPEIQCFQIISVVSDLEITKIAIIPVSMVCTLYFYQICYDQYFVFLVYAAHIPLMHLPVSQ